ncbi:GNAT family N-acetyltransferase [Actinoplanes sp. NPDC049668]|uniref:GNAT family N-acetyltransferase n=1 Tax=unclassified Actinoplanes TaxID=2626549 RepID=UPI0033BDE155
MAELIAPTARLHRAWLRSRDEWGRDTHQDGAGLRAGDEVDTPDGFAAWVRRLLIESDPAVPVSEGWVHCTYWWIVEDGEVLGAIALRHELNDFLARAGGHIGYGVRPSARRRGLASFALGEVLRQAGKLGLDRVLITCNVSNEASRRTIERNGGVLEDIRETEIGRLRRYWVDVSAD